MATAVAPRRNKQRKTVANDEDASKLIRENMKCPVCLEVLLPPIYQCETGHNICYLCVDEVTECPLCKSDYGDTRNYFAEELVNSMTFPCKFEEYGCHQTFLGSHLKEHQETCDCQPYRCPELACQEVVGIHQMSKHLDKHGFKTMKGDVHTATMEILDDHFDKKTEYNPWRVSAFGTEFYTVSSRNRDGIWYFWAYGLGLQKDVKKFSYEIVLFSDDKQIMYRGAVQSLRVSPEDVMKNGSCLITPDNVIKSLRKNGLIKCQMYFIQGKNWDTRNAKDKPKHGIKNLKKTLQKGKNKCLVPNTATYTVCSPSVSNTPSHITSQLPPTQTKSSKPRVLHSSIRSSTLDMLKDINNNLTNNTSKPKCTSGKTTKRSMSRQRVVSDDENNFVQKIRETLRCPACYEVITPPVYQCLIGHNVCHKCKSSRQDCALCRAPLSDCRNFFAEELLYKTYQRCPYFHHGCKVCLPSAQMRSHEILCEYAPFECPFNVCRTLLSADELFKHLQTHQITVVDKELKNEISVPRNTPSAKVCTIPNILTVDKIPFYPIVVRDVDGSWSFYVISQNHSKYHYELQVKKQSKTIAFQGPVLSLRTSYIQVKLRGSALMCTERTVKSFKSSDKLSYQLKIYKSEGGTPTGSVSSWVVSKTGDVVSKAELFANTKTSVSPNEDSDEEDESFQRNEDDVEVYISESEDLETESEMTSDADISLATTLQEDESDCNESYDFDSKGAPQATSTSLPKPRTFGDKKSQTELKRSKDAPLSTKRDTIQEKLFGSKSTTATSASNDNNKVKRNSVSDVNNNLVECDDAASSEASSVSGSVPSKNDTVSSNLESGSSDNNENEAQTSTARMGPSIHNLKLAEAVRNQSSHMIADPKPEKGKRSRSAVKNRVRMSDDVICCGGCALHITPIKGKGPSKSQANLRGSPSRLNTLSSLASKHVLSVQTFDENSTISLTNSSSVHEFDQLKQALEAEALSVPKLKHDTTIQLENAVSIPIFEEVGDILTVKSLNGMSEAISAVNDAVMSGGFDVVKSVISLFTSDNPVKSPDDSNENLKPAT